MPSETSALLTMPFLPRMTIQLNERITGLVNIGNTGKRHHHSLMSGMLGDIIRRRKAEQRTNRRAQKAQSLLYNEFSMSVGFVQLFLPLMILSLIGVMDHIPDDLSEAAAVWVRRDSARLSMSCSRSVFPVW